MNNTTRSSKLPKTSFNKGFTLIEMMVVVAIIGILSSIIVLSLTGAKGKARDARRVSDLGQLQLALELYFDRCNMYPQPLQSGAQYGVGQGVADSNTQCNKPKPGTNDYYTMSDFIAKIPTPTTEKGQAVYEYKVNATINATDYVLRAKLEYPSPATLDGLTGSPLSVACTSGLSDIYFCLGPK
ncbi:MAG: type II secretion system protein [Candidatus Taylorbacteria bacterium]